MRAGPASEHTLGVLIPIDNPADPRVAEYVRLHRGSDESAQAGTVARGAQTRDPDCFVAEGELIARLAVGSRFPVRSMLMSSAKVESMHDLIEQLAPGTPIYVAEPRLMSDIVGFKFHRGALVCCARAGALSVEAAVTNATAVVVLEQVSNFDNLGGIFRSVSALGGQRPAVLLSPGCCDPLYRKCIRVSMGHALRVPFAQINAENWPGALGTLAADGFSVIGLSTGPGAHTLHAIPPERTRRPAFVLGTEGAGLSEGTLAEIDRCGIRVRIPMRDGVDSLNVNVAAAIAMYGFGLVSGRN